ncbi:uncharacterized protein LOC144785614 [Lissotriton helveticus]
MEVYCDMKVPTNIMQVWEHHYKKLGYFTFPTPPSKCHSPEHHRCNHTHDTCPCQWKPILHLKANIYFNNKWNGPHDLICKAASLGSTTVGQEHKHNLNEDIERECAEIWGRETRRYTSNEGTPYNTKRAYKLKSPLLCFLGNGTVPVGRNTNCNSTSFNSDLMYGTTILMDIYWICGKNLYLQLPPQWQGLCSIVTMHELHLVVAAANISHIYAHPMAGDITLLHHRKGEAKKYSSDDKFQEIPEDFNDAELYFGGVIPMFQTKANARWLQVRRYELMQLVNNTRDGFNAVKEELRPLRLMVLKQHYVLDQLIAMNSGGCARMGKSFCCALILADDADNRTLTKAIEDLDNLGQQMPEDGSAKADVLSSWPNLDWMPSWLSAVLNFIMPILCVLVIVYCGTQIMLHYVRRLRYKKVEMNYTDVNTGMQGEDVEIAVLNIERTVPDLHLEQVLSESEYQSRVHGGPPLLSERDLVRPYETMCKRLGGPGEDLGTTSL